jgi:hypothetical protein
LSPKDTHDIQWFPALLRGTGFFSSDPHPVASAPVVNTSISSYGMKL